MKWNTSFITQLRGGMRTNFINRKKNLSNLCDMEKEFAFNLGDQVWLMHDNGVVCGTIDGMFYVKVVSCVDFTKVSDNEKYYVSVNGKRIHEDYVAKKLFETKEELLASL